MYYLYANKTKRFNALKHDYISPIVGDMDIQIVHEFPQQLNIDDVVVVLGEELFEATTHQNMAYHESVWINDSRIVCGYSLEDVLLRPNLYIDLIQQIRNPYFYRPNPPVSMPTYSLGLPAKLGKLVAFDIETTSLNSRCGEIVLVALADETSTYLVYGSEIRLLTDLFINHENEHTFIAHNGKFDQHWLRYHLGQEPKLSHDTLLLSYMLDERGGRHDLGQVAARWLGVPNYKKEIKQYVKKNAINYGKIPKEMLDVYAARDVRYTYDAYKLMYQAVVDEDLTRAYKFCLDASEALLELEYNGVKVDLDKARKLADKFTQNIEELTHECIQHSNLPGLNLNSPKQLSAYIFRDKNYPRFNGNSVDAGTIRKLINLFPDDKFLLCLSELRQVKKLLSTYVNPIINKTDTDGRLRCTFLVHGTETGRLSSSGPNLQNIPQSSKNKHAAEIRSLFIAEPGNVLVSCDLAQAELRVAANLSQESVMRDGFNADVDYHTATAQRMYGVDKVEKWQRNNAKTVNFAVLYGSTAYNIAAKLGITVQAAQAMLDLFFKTNPNLTKWLEAQKTYVRKHLQLRTRNGRLRRFPYITDANKSHIANQSTNTEIQSLASDINLQSLIWLVKWCKRHNKGIPVLIIHDDNKIETRAEDAELVMRKAKQLAKVAGKYILGTDFVQIEADASYGEYWK